MRDRLGGASAIGRSCAGAARAPGPTSFGQRPPSLSFRLRVSYHPTTRAHVRLLGPCFKTGREGGRRGHGPRARQRRATEAAARRTRALRTVRANDVPAERQRPPLGARHPFPRSTAGPQHKRAVTPPPRRRPPSRKDLDRRRTGRDPRRLLVRWGGARAGSEAAPKRPRTETGAPPRPTESEPAT